MPLSDVGDAVPPLLVPSQLVPSQLVPLPLVPPPLVSLLLVASVLVPPLLEPSTLAPPLLAPPPSLVPSALVPSALVPFALVPSALVPSPQVPSPLIPSPLVSLPLVPPPPVPIPLDPPPPPPSLKRSFSSPAMGFNERVSTQAAICWINIRLTCSQRQTFQINRSSFFFTKQNNSLIFFVPFLHAIIIVSIRATSRSYWIYWILSEDYCLIDWFDPIAWQGFAG